MIIKVERVLSLEDAIQYLLDQKNLEKRHKLFHVSYRNIENITDPAPELAALGGLAPKEAKVFVVVSICLEEGEVLSPKQWDLLRDEMARLLCECATISRGKGKKERVDARRLKLVWPVHTDTPNQHAQPLICKVDPLTKRLVSLNGYYDYYAWQYVARRLEEWFELHRHPHNFEPVRTVGMDGIVRYSDIPGREKRTELTLGHAAAEAHRAVESALRTLRRIHAGKSPEQFETWQDYGKFLEANLACVKPCANGLRGYVAGYHAPMARVSSLFSKKTLEAFLGPMPQAGEIGMAVEKQRRIHQLELERRLAAVKEVISKRDPEKAQWEVQVILRRLGITEFSYKVLDRNGGVRKRGTFELKNLSRATAQEFLAWEAAGCDVLFAPILEREKLVLPVLELSGEALRRLQQKYEPALTVQTGPDQYSVCIFVESLGNAVKDAIAGRLVAHKLRKEFGGQPAVPGMKLPLPPLFQAASAGFRTRLAEAKAVVCERASREMRIAWQRQQDQEARWWRGAAGKAADALQELPLSPDHHVELYRAQVVSLAADAMRRCHTPRMLDERVARRLLMTGMHPVMAAEVIRRGAALVQEKAPRNDWADYAQSVVEDAKQLARDRRLVPEWVELNRAATESARQIALAKRRDNRAKQALQHTAATTQEKPPAPASRSSEQKQAERPNPQHEQTADRQQQQQQTPKPLSPAVKQAIEKRLEQAQGLQAELARLHPEELFLEVWKGGIRHSSGMCELGERWGGAMDQIQSVLRRPSLEWEYTIRCLPPCPVGKQWLTSLQMPQHKFEKFVAAHRPTIAVRTRSSPASYDAAVLVDALADPKENQAAVERALQEWWYEYSGPTCPRPWCRVQLQSGGEQAEGSNRCVQVIPPGVALPGLPVAGSQEKVVLVEARVDAQALAANFLRAVLADRAAAVPRPTPDPIVPPQQNEVGAEHRSEKAQAALSSQNEPQACSRDAVFEPVPSEGKDYGSNQEPEFPDFERPSDELDNEASGPAEERGTRGPELTR